jgi:hypothetical protein
VIKRIETDVGFRTFAAVGGNIQRFDLCSIEVFAGEGAALDTAIAIFEQTSIALC